MVTFMVGILLVFDRVPGHATRSSLSLGRRWRSGHERRLHILHEERYRSRIVSDAGDDSVDSGSRELQFCIDGDHPAQIGALRYSGRAPHFKVCLHVCKFSTVGSFKSHGDSMALIRLIPPNQDGDRNPDMVHWRWPLWRHRAPENGPASTR
jgi:hypothetical protein